MTICTVCDDIEPEKGRALQKCRIGRVIRQYNSLTHIFKLVDLLEFSNESLGIARKEGEYQDEED